MEGEKKIGVRIRAVFDNLHTKAYGETKTVLNDGENEMVVHQRGGQKGTFDLDGKRWTFGGDDVFIMKNGEGSTVDRRKMRDVDGFKPEGPPERHRVTPREELLRAVEPLVEKVKVIFDRSKNRSEE